MRIKQVGNKPDAVAVVIRNAEASATIPRGTPVVLKLSGTNDGMDVVLPSTAGNALSSVARYGIAADTILAGQWGEAVVFGFTPYALITRMTRAASTDSWTSSDSIASGVGLGGIDTLAANNALLVGASAAGSVSQVPMAFLASSVSSQAASASATSDSRTSITAAVRAFIRMM